ncbi:unnamed protein product, partial [Mesorhabditis belari]|uniref:Signal transducer and activator of transcription n=1 Tax=Mesorhabditis belari TaxID=2138241 RepID=A0AAF3FNK2_9BILA
MQSSSGSSSSFDGVEWNRIVNRVLNAWGGYQLAVQMDAGGPDTKEKHEWFASVLAEHIHEKKGLKIDNLEEWMENILYTDFDLVLEDDSINPTSHILLELHRQQMSHGASMMEQAQAAMRMQKCKKTQKMKLKLQAPGTKRKATTDAHVFSTFSSFKSRLAIEFIASGQQCSTLYEETRQKQAEFINYICELQRLQGIMTQIEAEQNPEKLQKKRSQSTSVLHNGMQIVLELQTELINNRLFSWKNQQRMNKIGFPHDDAEGKLDELQKEFQWLIEQIWQLRTHASYQMELMQRGPQNNNDQNSPIFAQNLSLIVEQLNNVLKTLTFHSFIVSKQPELILKTSTKFKTRLLIGDSLGMRQNLRDAKQLAIGQSDEKNIRSIGEITNALEKITMNDKGHICAKFDNSKLMKVMARGKQQGRSSNDQKSSTATTITDQKYALLFQISSFQFESLGKMDIWIAMSEDRSCGESPFGGTNWNQDGVDSDHAVSWANLYPVLQYQFKEFTGAKRLLNESDLRYLYEKLFNSSAINLEATINFERFARVNLHGTNFSFWDWFYSIMCLVKQKLLKYWEDGWCIGFITKQDANDILKQGPAFLLRFSDSQMGAVSIGFSTPNIPSHLAPFTTRDLDLLSISQRIATCPQLKDTIQCIMGKMAQSQKKRSLR